MMYSNEGDHNIEQERQRISSELFEKSLDRCIKALKLFSKKLGQDKGVLDDAIKAKGIDMDLYKTNQKQAIKNAVNDQKHGEIDSFLNGVLEALRNDQRLKATPQLSANTLYGIYHRATSPNNPQWVQDIDFNTGLISEVIKAYEHMEDMKCIKSYCFFGTTVLGALGADYLIYKLAEVSPIAKIASIVISNAFVVGLLSYVTEYAKYKKVPLEEKLRKCQHLFKDDYTCPQPGSENDR